MITTNTINQQDNTMGSLYGSRKYLVVSVSISLTPGHKQAVRIAQAGQQLASWRRLDKLALERSELLGPMRASDGSTLNTMQCKGDSAQSWKGEDVYLRDFSKASTKGAKLQPKWSTRKQLSKNSNRKRTCDTHSSYTPRRPQGNGLEKHSNY